MNRTVKIVLATLGVFAIVGIAGYAGFMYMVGNFGAMAAEFAEVDHSELTRQRFASDEARLAGAKDEYSRWANLPPAALGNAVAGDSARGEALADELLELSLKYRGDWNYGNAIHYANLAKGHAAFKRGDREAARRYLLAAGDTPGSPQLNTFGPTMNLARDFLLAGERDTVLAYIEKLERFWKMDAGALEKWRSMILEGRTPNFSMNLY